MQGLAQIVNGVLVCDHQLAVRCNMLAQAFQPGSLHRIAQGAHQEAAGLAKQVAALQQAIELIQRATIAAPAVADNAMASATMEVD